MKLFKKVLLIFVLFLVLLGAPMIAKLITNSFDFRQVDPENVFAWYMVRHFLQVAIILVLIFLISNRFKLNFHFSIGSKEVGINYLKKFMLIFTIGCITWYLVMYFLGQIQPYSFDYSLKNILGYLMFQLFFTGPSEEIIFRAFAMTCFSYFISNKRFNNKISHANLFAAIVFGLAHIGISFSPFSISFVIPQIIISIILSYFYGDCYEKSKSIIYPIIMHSFTNVVMVGLTFILSGIFN